VPTLVPLFAATIACDVAGQLCSKIGSSRLPAHDGPDRGGFLRGLVSDGWLLAGIAAYVGQLIVWVQILSIMPLSAAFPIASLTFLVVALACRVFLSERLDAGQFAGVVLVMAGVAIVAGAA
jgi:drug/metabolite transporter (DMT)-like permease